VREPQDSVDRAIREEIVLVPYRDEWPALFLQEKRRLTGLFPDRLLDIEHFGSTAVPGMSAKPTVDMLAGVESMAVADALFAPLLQAGYTTSRAFNAMLPDRRWFMRVADGRRTHHLHLVEHGGPQWLDRLRFRDALRSDARLARRYGELKAELAAKHRFDREAYTAAKGAFVAAVLASPQVSLRSPRQPTGD
jgi:GrpB-like predicted nucleotidyltransferase (UPF0157 family)